MDDLLDALNEIARTGDLVPNIDGVAEMAMKEIIRLRNDNRRLRNLLDLCGVGY
jgi:hypothetical protein